MRDDQTTPELYQTFWSGFERHVIATKCPIKFRYSTNKQGRWVKLSLPQKDVVVEVRVVDQEQYIAAQLRLMNRDSHADFKRLYRYRTVIEGKIGSPLDWEGGAERQACTATLRQSFDPREQDKWGWAYRWIVEQATLFYATFAPYCPRV